MKTKKVKAETVKVKAEFTEDMFDDLVSFDGIDINQIMEDTLTEELEKAMLKERIEKREKKIDVLLDEDEQD